MDSAPLPSAPAVVSPNSSSLSSSDTEEVVNYGHSGNFNQPHFPARVNTSVSDCEQNGSCFVVVLVLCCFVSMVMIEGVYGPENVWIGPNSSILIEPNPIFVQSVKVKDLDESVSGLELFGFYRSPPLDVVVNWSESRLAPVSHKSSKGWPFYLNEGASLNISYSVKPKGHSVRLVVGEGSGMIKVKISKSSSYYVAVANSNMKDVEVELDFDVRAVLYDTKQSIYNFTLSKGECTFNAMSLVGNSIVLTSQEPRQGVSVEDQEWYIRFSYQPRWIAYVIGTGLVTCFMLVAIQLWKRLPCLVGERYLTENDSARTRLLANKDDDGSSTGSSFAADDAEFEDFIGSEGEASNGTRRLCAICLDSQRDCFFLPCGHCVSCYQCGTMIAQAAGNCPICRRKMKKVKRIYTA
ncbi:hypothetical protein EUTSA_v10016735mg [Eutrema salsugineum]|uniref:RING-type E3 ubiquitin transferase n=1 Tax=Eutrema salsugineum TaxID=72664 RepID=V4MBI8_EUTSA|nr:hypothetical protein EUTSA_v10016735mg [Eutrema salsugineum]